jgi:hypothetical protein
MPPDSTKLWILVHHHRHGVDTVPYYGVHGPSEEEQKALFDFEEENDEWLGCHGPHNLPDDVLNQADFDSSHYTLRDLIESGKDWRDYVYRLTGYPAGPPRTISKVNRNYADGKWPVNGKLFHWPLDRFVVVGPRKEWEEEIVSEHVDEPDVRPIDVT